MIISLPVPKDWPEQKVKMIEEDVSNNVRKLDYRELENSLEEMYGKPVVPHDFEVPLGLETERLRLRPLADADWRQTAAVVDAVRLARIAPSLGGVESLIEQPLVMSYFEASPEDRRAWGIYDNMIRLSCGIDRRAAVVPTQGPCLSESAAPQRNAGSPQKSVNRRHADHEQYDRQGENNCGGLQQQVR